MTAPIHFYLTFNPGLNTYPDRDNSQAHEFYHFLKKRLQDTSQGNSSEAYAYWGKIINKDRKAQVSIEKFKYVLDENKKLNSHTHLYITDFKNLWVGKVTDVLTDIGQDYQTLSFYKGKKVEIWFKITDFTLLEHTSVGTLRKMSELYIDNPHMDMKIEELSPFTTGIKYPAFIQDLAEEAYFAEEAPLALRNNPTISSVHAGHVLKNIQNFIFPEALYNKFPFGARHEIESAEMDMLEERTHNFSKVAFSYIKALEIIVNDLTVNHLKRQGLGDQIFVKTDVMPPKIYLHPTQDGLIPLKDFSKSFSLGQLIYLAQRAIETHHLPVLKAYKDRKEVLKYLAQDFSEFLHKNQILEVRGLLAHQNSQELSLEDALAVRNLIMGIGSEGPIHTLYRLFYPDLEKLFKVDGDYHSDQQNLANSATPTNHKKKHLKIAS